MSNAKTTIAGTYHGVKEAFLQGYLNEFFYKFKKTYQRRTV